MLKLVQSFKYPYLNGIFIPFKVYANAAIKIKKNAEVKMRSRLTIGNPDLNAACISKQKTNIYIGNKSNVDFGSSISIGSGVNIIVKDNAKLEIGDCTYFTSDMHIEVVNKVRIGSNCAISWGVTIIDDDHHIVIKEEKKTEGIKHVKIGNHVWIGCNTIILKGTEIGDNCIVAAGSVVKGVFPPQVMIAGNPAKIIKQNVNWE